MQDLMERDIAAGERALLVGEEARGMYLSKMLVHRR